MIRICIISVRVRRAGELIHCIGYIWLADGMEIITDRHEHKYKHRAGVPWHRLDPQVKCGKVSLRGYVNKEEEENNEGKQKEEEEEEEVEEVCASCVSSQEANKQLYGKYM